MPNPYLRLRNLRKINNISLEKLSNEVGISPSYLAMLEKGFALRLRNPVQREALNVRMREMEVSAKEILAEDIPETP